MARIQALSCLFILLFVPIAAAQSPTEKQTALLAENLTPWLDALAGRSERTAIRGSVSPKIDGSARTIEFAIQRYSTDAFDLSAEHKDYAMAIRRRGDTTVLALPKHKKAYFGKGDVDATDHLHPAGLLQRLVSPGSSVSLYAGMILNADPKDLAGTLIGLADLKFDEARGVWQAGDDVTIEFSDHGRQIKAVIDGTPVKLTLGEPDKNPAPAIELPEYDLKEVSRADLERQLCRGIRRAGEILAPSALLTSPAQKSRRVDHGELRWIEGSRVALLWGTPEQIGEAHGKLLKAEAQRCIDSVLYTFGTVQTIVTGRWFRDDLASAYARLESHIPERHKQETAALARSLGQDEMLIQTVNVFPELFHCSGFAVFGKATKDGKLYHGRVLDYMTEIGLQDASVTFIVAPTGHHAFANVGYAGFIGSVSGMNAEKISLGEMGGRGEGKWDGVPMATLMRRALEECSSLEEVKQLWRDSPRTCEYYYVFADGETKSAVGVAATPDALQFVGPGEGHELLGEGIPDAVVLSAGSRLEELRARVKKDYGKIDAQIGPSLMCRPVAMKSNLHNVLFVPEDGVLYVANADHQEPAADRPYIKLDLNELLASMPKADKTKEAVSLNERYPAKDSLSAGNESKEDAAACLAGLVWQPADFEIKLEPAVKDNGDALVRFPSAVPSGDAINDSVAMEWYQVKDEQGRVVKAPAAVIVHESGSGMTVGRLIARGLRMQGVHTFMIQLPYYGVRKGPQGKPTGERVITALRQAIADVRRAYDAVAAIPAVDKDRISLQGTSLGGFVTATTAGLDHAYHRVFILLAGGDLYSVLMEGKQDAANMRKELSKYGVSEERIKETLGTIEPLRLAHRIDAKSTWLFSGQFDDVVPPRSSALLAEAAGLDDSHHVRMLANHYSGVIFLPHVLESMREIMTQ